MRRVQALVNGRTSAFATLKAIISTANAADDKINGWMKREITAVVLADADIAPESESAYEVHGAASRENTLLTSLLRGPGEQEEAGRLHRIHKTKPAVMLQSVQHSEILQRADAQAQMRSGVYTPDAWKKMTDMLREQIRAEQVWEAASSALAMYAQDRTEAAQAGQEISVLYPAERAQISYTDVLAPAALDAHTAQGSVLGGAELSRLEEAEKLSLSGAGEIYRTVQYQVAKQAYTDELARSLLPVGEADSAGGKAMRQMRQRAVSGEPQAGGIPWTEEFQQSVQIWADADERAAKQDKLLTQNARQVHSFFSHHLEYASAGQYKNAVKDTVQQLADTQAAMRQNARYAAVWSKQDTGYGAAEVKGVMRRAANASSAEMLLRSMQEQAVPCSNELRWKDAYAAYMQVHRQAADIYRMGEAVLLERQNPPVWHMPEIQGQTVDTAPLAFAALMQNAGQQASGYRDVLQTVFTNNTTAGRVQTGADAGQPVYDADRLSGSLPALRGDMAILREIAGNGAYGGGAGAVNNHVEITNHNTFSDQADAERLIEQIAELLAEQACTSGEGVYA